MPKYVAFLRAINVGGHTVSMERIRALFTEMDLSEVETLIASGNVVFVSRARNIDSLERRIATHLHAALGFEVDTFVRTIAELGRLRNAVPFDDTAVAGAHAMMIGFLAVSPGRAVVAAVAALSGATDTLRLVGREIYWLRHSRDSDPALARQIERALGAPMTVRNVTTIGRLLARHGEGRAKG